MTDWTIREGKESDASSIAAIINHEIRTGLAIWRYAERSEVDIRAMIAERLEAGQGVFVAENGGAVIGWAGYCPFRAGEGYSSTVEHSVHIVPDAQGHGLGRALMQRLLDHAKAQGIHAVIAAIDSTLVASLALHRSLDFEEIGRLPEIGWKFDRRLTLVLMQKTL